MGLAQHLHPSPALCRVCEQPGKKGGFPLYHIATKDGIRFPCADLKGCLQYAIKWKKEITEQGVYHGPIQKICMHILVNISCV